MARLRRTCQVCKKRRHLTPTNGQNICDACKNADQPEPTPEELYLNDRAISKLMQNGPQYLMYDRDVLTPWAKCETRMQKMMEAILIREDGHTLGVVPGYKLDAYMSSPVSQWIGVIHKPSSKPIPPREWVNRYALTGRKPNA